MDFGFVPPRLLCFEDEMTRRIKYRRKVTKSLGPDFIPDIVLYKVHTYYTQTGKRNMGQEESHRRYERAKNEYERKVFIFLCFLVYSLVRA